MLAFRPVSSLSWSALFFKRQSLDSDAVALSEWLDRWRHERRAMNQALQLENAPAGTAAADPGDETAATDSSDGEVVPDEPIPKQGGPGPAVDDELPEEQLMWLGRS
jgi:hypothetical protein